MKKKIIIIGICFIITLCFIMPKDSLALPDTNTIYKQPDIIPDTNPGNGLDDMIRDAEEFEKEKGATAGGKDSKTFQLNQGKLQIFSSDLYTVLIITATAVTIIVGIIIGIKYMVGSAEAKAEYKKLLVPYLVGCATIYGALGIWKLLVTVLASV